MKTISKEQWLAILEQAQVFASAWAFVDGPFDDGSGMQNARKEQAELAAMFDALPDAQNAIAPSPMSEITEGVRKDAERYKWLRDVSVSPHNFYISVPEEFHGERYSTKEVDTYIDNAIKALQVKS